MDSRSRNSSEANTIMTPEGVETFARHTNTDHYIIRMYLADDQSKKKENWFKEQKIKWEDYCYWCCWE